MKKPIYHAIALLALSAALTNCAADADLPAPRSGAIPFGIEAAPATRTAADGFGTVWTAADKLNLFHVREDLCTDCGEFTVSSEEPASGRFSGTLPGELDPAAAYDWLAVYPYSANTTAPDRVSVLIASTTQRQTDNGATTHAAGSRVPLYGRISALAGSETPVFRMRHLGAMIRVRVTNREAAELRVARVSLTSAAFQLVGSFTVDLGGDRPAYSNSSREDLKSTTLLVDQGRGGTAIPTGGSADFYLVVRPFEAAADETLALTVTGADGRSSERTVTIPAGKSLPAGKITTLAIDYEHARDASDLSADGTANCYIVSAKGTYSFDATVMGNGAGGIIPEGGFTDYLGNPLSESAAISPVSAEVLWQTVEAGVVSDVALTDEGRISFTATGAAGNALIAARDAEGRIVWSWHIWATDRPADQTYMQNPRKHVYTFMDRNLGATSAEVDVRSLGLLYQWGRKDPLPGATAWYSNTEPVLYGQVTGVTETAADAGTTIAQAIRNPHVHYYQRNADWLYGGRNDYLWGNPDGTTYTQDFPKSIYDPCPAGYKVPGVDAYMAFTTTGSSSGELNAVPNEGTQRGWMVYYTAYGEGPAAWYPYTGRRDSNGSMGRGSYIYYWTSAALAGQTRSFCLSYNNSNWTAVNPLEKTYRATATAVRCVKE